MPEHQKMKGLMKTPVPRKHSPPHEPGHSPCPSIPGHAACCPSGGHSTSHVHVPTGLEQAGPVLQGGMSPSPLGSILCGPTLAPGSIKMMEVQVTRPGNKSHRPLVVAFAFLSGTGVKLGFPGPLHPHPFAHGAQLGPARSSPTCLLPVSTQMLLATKHSHTHGFRQGLGIHFADSLGSPLQWDHSARLPPTCPLGHVRPNPVQKRHVPLSTRSALGVS